MGIGLDGFSSALNVAADRLGLLGVLGGNTVPGTSMAIEVKNGPKIILRDRAMPLQTIEFGVEARTKKTIYPGNPNASIQILGFDNLPTEIEGEWNYRFLPGSVLFDGDSNVIQTPAQLCDQFDRIVRSGRQVRVQWMHLVRYGILKKFVPEWPRANDCKWSMSFEWLSADDDAPARPGIPSSGFGISDLVKAMNFVEDVLALAPDLARSLSAALVTLVKDVRAKVSTLIQAFGAIEALINLPAAVLGAIDAAISSICLECQEMIRRLSGPRISSRQAEIALIAAAALSASPTSPGGAPKSSAAQQSTFEAWARTLAAAVDSLRFLAIMLGVQVRVQNQPEATKVVTAREGETLWSISRREYGSPDYANYLAQQNGLQGAALTAGTIVRVPARPYGAAPDVEPTGTQVITVTNPGGCEV